MSQPSKGEIHLVHLYPREMSIYGDLGNTRCLAARLRWHGYTPVVHDHAPGDIWPERADVILGGGGQDSGQVRVTQDLDAQADRLRDLAEAGIPMLMVCGMYQLFGKAFTTLEGKILPGLGILDVTTQGNDTRMIGPVVLDTEFGKVVGYENHSGSTALGEGQRPFGTVLSGFGNNRIDKVEGARIHNVVATYLHGPVLPSNPTLADGLLEIACRAVTGDFIAGIIDDSTSQEAHGRQVSRLVSSARAN